MAKIYTSLPTVPLAAGISFMPPPETLELTHLDDPAQPVMINPLYYKANAINGDTDLDSALLAMKLSGLPILLVTDSRQQVLGVASSEDLLGERPLRVMQEGILRRSEVLVKLVMTKQTDLAAIFLDDLRHAKVGNIIQTLYELKLPYLVIVALSDITQQQLVCGLFSLSLLSKQLGFDVTSRAAEAHSIIELQQHLNY
jgi:hypothetical protein